MKDIFEPIAIFILVIRYLLAVILLAIILERKCESNREEKLSFKEKGRFHHG
jgi:hypothetical protein